MSTTPPPAHPGELTDGNRQRDPEDAVTIFEKIAASRTAMQLVEVLASMGEISEDDDPSDALNIFDCAIRRAKEVLTMKDLIMNAFDTLAAPETDELSKRREAVELAARSRL